ncbi:MAG TPA: dihydroneopterin aldolase [Burkholderiaceae bacterium]|nr:dihydroneopterin aldolase [Burkholderiaceae bacterium]
MNAAELLRSLPAARPGEDTGEPLDVIFIEGLQAQTVIGIHQNELHRPQPVRLDIAAGIPRSLACRTDRIGDTIDYSLLRTALLELLATHRLKLLEALAEEMAHLALEEFGAHWVRVVLTKPAKFDDLAAVGVAIERRREVRAREPASVLTLIGSGMVPTAAPE